MHTQQHIINHLFELFTYLAKQNNSALTIDNSYKAVTTKDSSWPNFIFDVNPSKETFKAIASDIADNKLPKHIILDSSQVDANEDLLIENNFLPIAEWSCLKLENTIPKKVQSKNLNIKKITTPQELTEWINVASTGFETLNLKLFKNCLHNKEFALYGGYSNNKMVTTALLFYHNDTAGIYHIVTLPEERGNGFGSEIFSYCEQESIDNGATQVIAQSTSDGLNAWMKTGMKSYGNFYLFCWNKPKQ